MRNDTTRDADRRLPPQLVALVAERFRVLADPVRLQILSELYAGERTVTALMEALGQSHANVSKHLQQLHRAGFVARRKAGLHVYYRLADEDVFQLCDIMCNRLKTDADRRRDIVGAISGSTAGA